ncbi:L-threonylcarbamoyladenylate synthase [Cupriavidus pauculus]|uniref:Threonylcarbamoyl-AMP synthase n=1 Tax=Cupriavidus pauculus TaxID=82633 RepID=A0A2N5CJI5_9BURK|nr:L-threonylcarbamoyladenylate synthase [Cupriavidus pauculus]PLQ02396.1 threonylcarbamoyl-AMP synthase [Cupriavidus pauculus]
MSSRMPTAAELDEAVRLLEAGQLVAFPTETVYGLGADAENPEAVARIFAAKGRPSNHPVIVHVVDGGDVSYWTDDVPEAAQKLIDAFWPGPLTIILKRAAHIPADVAGGQDSIGLRCPSHPVAQALLARFKRGRGGIAAPSANKFGQVSPTTAEHVRDEFGGTVYVLEGDGVDVGIESSIVDLSRLDTLGPVLLRPGAITAAMMADVLGTLPLPPDAAAPRASGTLKAHYAPRTTLTLAQADALPQLLHGLPDGGRLVFVGKALASADARCVFVAAPATPDAYAQALYGLLRKLDKEGYQRLVFEPVPDSQAWDGVRDRLGRAAAAFEDS